MQGNNALPLMEDHSYKMNSKINKACQKPEWLLACFIYFFTALQIRLKQLPALSLA